MESILQNIEWLTIAFTFLGGIYMYVNHTRKLNKQQEKINEQDARLNEQQHQLNGRQKQINDYQIRKNREEELERKQARIEAYVTTSKEERSSTWQLVIRNEGRAKAANVFFESETIEKDDKTRIYVDNSIFPLPCLLPQKEIGLNVTLCMGHRKIHRIKFTWDDESGIGRSQEQDVIFD